MIRQCSAVSLVLLVGCAIELDDIAGRACDDAHPCRAPRACVAARCVDPMLPDGGSTTDSGVPDSGMPIPDGGSGSDAGIARWQQRLHGFTNTTIDTGCMLQIDTARGNNVIATIVGPADNQDTATAEFLAPTQLPRTLEGRIKGRITLAAPINVSGYVPLIFLGTQTGQAFVRAGFDNQGLLVVESDPQTVGASSLVERFSVDGGFTAGDWIIEVSYRVGTGREVRINDAVVSYALVNGGATMPPNELSLGIARYDGTTGGAFTVTLSG